MKFTVIAAIAVAGLMGSPAFAQTKIGDWTIERRQHDQHCTASRAFKDSDGDITVVVLTYSKSNIVLVVIYDGWEWDKTGVTLKAEFSTDRSTIIENSNWEVMDKTTVRGMFEFDQSILDKISKAKQISIDFENDDDNSIEFETPRAGEAVAALKFCEENLK